MQLPDLNVEGTVHGYTYREALMFASTLPKNTMTQIRQVALVRRYSTLRFLSLSEIVSLKCTANQCDSYFVRAEERRMVEIQVYIIFYK